MKELPYFRFTCQEWDSGDISLESHSTKGLFIDICSYYWSQNCGLSLDKLSKKVGKMTQKSQRKARDKLLLLAKCGVLKITGDKVNIGFLDVQLAEINKKHEFLSKKGKEGAKKREENKQAPLKPPLSNKIDKDKDKDKIEIDIKKKNKKHSFDKSIIFCKIKFKERFPNWDSEMLNHYYNAALEYSGSKGAKYLDWGLAISSWQRKENLKQKTIQHNRPKSFKQQEEDEAIAYMEKINQFTEDVKNGRMENTEAQLISSGDNEDVFGVQ